MKLHVLKIREYREAAGMNKTELAKKMGVSIPTITRWERGEDNPLADRLPALAEALDCTIDQLYGRNPASQDSA